jgi:hypothetical protein
MVTKYAKWPKNIPKGHRTYQHFPWQDPPKFTQVGIFGLKINHLATLLPSQFQLKIPIFIRRKVGATYLHLLERFEHATPMFSYPGEGRQTVSIFEPKSCHFLVHLFFGLFHEL